MKVDDADKSSALEETKNEVVVLDKMMIEKSISMKEDDEQT